MTVRMHLPAPPSNHLRQTYVLNSHNFAKGQTMELVDRSYKGFYARLEPANQKQSGMFMSADNLVGDDFEIFFKVEEGRNVAWARNRFDAEVGYFDADTSRKLQLAKARDQKIRCLLSFVAFSDSTDPGYYWGQMALFCFNPAYAEEMDAFVDRCAAKFKQGVRPRIDLGSQAVEKIFTEKDWTPSETVSTPSRESGSAILKDHLTVSEKVVEQARAGNKGCYVISWLFIIVVVVAIVYGLAHLFGVL